MADLSHLSDDELMALYNKGPTPAAAPTTDLSKMSDDELLAAYKASTTPKLTATADVIKEGAKGLGRGLAGAAGDVGEAVAGPFGPSHHFANLMADLGITDRPKAEPGYGEQISKAAGIEASPQTTQGRYAGKIGEFVGNPESYLNPGSTLAKGATAAGAAIGSEALGDLATKFAPDSPRAKAAAQMIGAIAGGHGVAQSPRLITPNIVSDERMAHVNLLRNEGVPLRAGDVTGIPAIKAAESQLSTGINDAQDRAFKQAAFNRVGEAVGDRPILGQTGAVNTMMNRTGTTFEGLVARNRAEPDMDLVNDLRNIHSTYNDVPGLYPPDVVNAVNGSIDRVMNVMFNRPGAGMTGAEYQTLRSNLRKAAMGATDPQRAEGLHGVTNALDDAMARTIQRTNPADIGAWEEARRDYRNALVLKDWAGSANMTPATLAQAAKRVYGKDQYVRGRDDFSDLAEAGRYVLKQYPDSGTASRFNIERAMSNVGGALSHALSAGGGYAAGSHLGGIEGGVGGLLLGEAIGPFALRPAARFGLMNPLTQGILSNQALPYQMARSPNAVNMMNAVRGNETPPVPNARKAKDGKWYVPDPSRPGKYLEARP